MSLGRPSLGLSFHYSVSLFSSAADGVRGLCSMGLATTSADEAYLADPTADMAPTFNALQGASAYKGAFCF